MSWARRGADHRSVGKPYSVGESDNQRSTIFSWVLLSLGGGPGAGLGRAARPSSPWRRKAASQRQTLRGATSRKSATSSVEYPSARRWTARRRRRCSSTAVPTVLMQEIAANRRPY